MMEWNFTHCRCQSSDCSRMIKMCKPFGVGMYSFWWSHPPLYKSWCSDHFPAGDCLGNQSLVLGRGFLQCTPYLLYLLTDERWSQDKTTFCLPEATEFQSGLTLLLDLIRFSVNPPEQFALPSYQRLFQLVRLSDFIGCEQFLEMVVSRLGVQSLQSIMQMQLEQWEG